MATVRRLQGGRPLLDCVLLPHMDHDGANVHDGMPYREIDSVGVIAYAFRKHRLK